MTSAPISFPNVRMRIRTNPVPRPTPIVRVRTRPASVQPTPSTPTVPVIRHRTRRQTIASTKVGDLQVEWRPIDSLTPYPRNARTHSERQVAQIAASIREFGFTEPLLIDERGRIIAGHGRLDAARSLGMTSVPTIQLLHLTEAQKKALTIGLNRIAEKAGWDTELLALELQELADLDLDFDVEITGWSTAEVDLLIEGLEGGDDSKADALPDIDSSTPAVSRVGDLWMLGRHRLICADTLDIATFSRLMGEERARVGVQDMPYNVPISGHVCGQGRVRHREFLMASGEMSETEFIQFLTTAFANITRYSLDGALHFAFIDAKHLYEALSAGRATFTELKGVNVWNKTNAGLGALYRQKAEFILVLKHGKAAHVNNVMLGASGRYRTSVWDYAGVNSFKAHRLDELEMHPTVKPVALVADAICDVSRRNDIVLDGFCGSGTTIIAAQKTGRIARAIELDPIYVDVAIRRWQAFTGEIARHAETNKSFEDISRERSGAGQADEDKGARATNGDGHGA